MNDRDWVAQKRYARHRMLGELLGLIGILAAVAAFLTFCMALSDCLRLYL